MRNLARARICSVCKKQFINRERKFCSKVCAQIHIAREREIRDRSKYLSIVPLSGSTKIKLDEIENLKICPSCGSKLEKCGVFIMCEADRCLFTREIRR